MNESVPLVIFRVDQQRYGLPLSVVERIVRAAEVTLLPKAPAMVIGVLDIEGRVLPVLNIRRRLGMPEREISPINQFVIARTPRRGIVFVIDEALGVVDVPSTGMLGAAQIVPGMEHIRGVVQLPGGLVLIQDLEKFLSLEEERALDAALKEGVAHAH